MKTFGRWLRGDPNRPFWILVLPLAAHAVASLLFPRSLSGSMGLLVLLWLAVVTFAYYRGRDS